MIMKQFILLCLFIAGCLFETSAYGEDLSAKKKDKNIDYQFVTDHTQRTEIESSFFGCSFGSSQAAIAQILKNSKDINISESTYGSITLKPLFFHDMLFQTAQLLFSENRFYGILFGSSFKNYEDALNVYLRTKKYLAEEYGPSMFKQKKEDMTNVYDLKGKNACMLTLTKKGLSDGTIRFHLILNYWNKDLQPQP